MGIYCRGLLFETVNTQGNGARTPRKGRRNNLEQVQMEAEEGMCFGWS